MKIKRIITIMIAFILAFTFTSGALADTSSPWDNFGIIKQGDSGGKVRGIQNVTKYYLNHEMERGCKASGVKKIRVHDLRHSHVSLLINMGYTALAIGKRVGHSAEKITYRYAHLFPSVQQDMADQLDAENMNEESNDREGGLAYVS